MDLAETMKNIVAKGMQTEMGPPGSSASYLNSASSAGYITEKIYMLLQLYLQNKGWNHSIELLQCFSELKETSMLPSAAYLQVMASRVALNSQGILVLRENGKMILPYEQFANAVMMKHMINGPHAPHLSLEGTVRAVMESFTIGRENFGMEKEFIIEVVQKYCLNTNCRYYKNQLELTQKLGHMGPTYISDNEASSLLRSNFSHGGDFQASMIGAGSSSGHLGGPAGDLQELRNSSNQMNHQRPPSRPSLNIPHRSSSQDKKSSNKQHYESLSSVASSMTDHKLSDFLRSNLENFEGLRSGALGLGVENLQNIGNSNKDLLALHNGAWTIENDKDSRSAANSECGQEKIIRTFTEIMKNMARMKSCVRPAMCKPYGKQSEALQKTVVDTMQLVQSLRSILPPPHIPVSSWKNEDKHRLDHGSASYLPSMKSASLEDMCEQRKLD